MRTPAGHLPATPEEAPDPPVGLLGGMRAGDVLFGQYVLVEPLGTGLGGETWRATPVTPGPVVAVKVLAKGSDWRAQRDMLAEATFLRELDHPNIVPYLGMVDLPGGGMSFLLTEYVAGGNLASWIAATGPCDTWKAASLLAQIAAALDAVHGRGILHRDLKPQNVLVQTGAGLPRLLVADFGVSRRSVQDVTSVTRIAGTPGYAAPEVWRGGTLNAAADVYGLGAIGWFLLTGVEPLPVMGVTTLDAQELFWRVSRDTQLHGGALLRLIAEMLALQPSARPSLADVRQRLAAVLEAASKGFAGAVGETYDGPPHTRDLPIEDRAELPRPTLAAPPADDWEPPKEGRGPWLLALTVAFVAMLVACGVGGWMMRAPPPVTRAPAPEVALPAAPAPPVEPPRPDPAPVAEPTVAAIAAVPEARTPAAPDAGPVVTPAPRGPIERLRVGVSAPAGLPAEATLDVRTSDGAARSSASTQVVLHDVTSGIFTVGVRSATRTLGEDHVYVPPGQDVRVLCKAPAANFQGLSCTVQP